MQIYSLLPLLIEGLEIKIQAGVSLYIYEEMKGNIQITLSKHI